MSPNHGSFSDNPKTEWLANPASADRDMKLLEDFSYTDPDGREWPAPQGSVVNGASIPRPLWSTVGSPYTDDYRNASVVHDVAVDNPAVNRKEADKMFYYACLAGGCSLKQARLLYVGVRIGSWASGPKNLSPFFSRKKMLFRLPGEKTNEEAEVLDMFDKLFRAVAPVADTMSFEQLEKIVDVAVGK